MFPLLRDVGSCPVCCGEGLRALHVYPNSRRAFSPALNLALVGCPSCGVVFSHPLPSEDELSSYYSEQEGWEQRIPESEIKVQRRLEAKRSRGARHLAALESVIGAPGADHPKAFDFGCGLGGWLDVLKAAGWETYGFEPGPRARRIAAREHTMLDEVPATPAFDLIIVSQVLEHVRDPLAVTRSLAAATKDGGYVYVSVPDFGRLPEHRSFGYVKNERHIFSYTSASLGSLLALSGLELVAHSNQRDWPGEPVDKNDAKGLKVVSRRTERELPRADDPLDEAIASLRAYEAHAAERLLESPEPEVRPQARTPSARSRPPVADAARALAREWRASLRRALKPVRRFVLVRLRAAVGARLARSRP